MVLDPTPLPHLVLIADELAVLGSRPPRGCGHGGNKPQATLIALYPQFLLRLLDRRLQTVISGCEMPADADVPHARKRVYTYRLTRSTGWTYVTVIIKDALKKGRGDGGTEFSKIADGARGNHPFA